MTRVDKISEVRHLRFQQGLSFSEIIKRTKLARNTIRNIIRSGKTENTYHRDSTPQPQTGPFRETIKGWIKEDSDKRRKQRRTATRIYAILRDEHGYTGSYESIAKCVQEIREELNLSSKESYIPLSYGPGEAFQFDWGEVMVYISGKLVKVYIGIVVLCHSRHFFVRAYPCQKQELMLDIRKRHINPILSNS